ncbi:MAG: prolyl oligopeptidase family serine peptidase [candidate division Zixibacteria bacterium]|nr:prolyl oligopeptidase family serine peptidase [candidate division Zixibacteria bacterium]
MANGLYLCILLLFPGVVFADTEHTQLRTLSIGKMERTYRVHVPPSYHPGVPAAVVMAFHGGESDAQRIEKTLRFSAISDRENLIVVYPNAVDGHWNDGRKSALFAKHDKKVDDVSFVLKMLKALRKEFSIDTTRVFAVGVSNGGIFVQRLAVEHADLFASIGSVVASIPEPLKERFRPSARVSAIFINRTDDRFVPYAGGEVSFHLLPMLKTLRRPPDRGRVLSTEESVNLWVQYNRATSTRLSARIPDHEPRDGATAEMFVYSGGDRETFVSLYRVNGGGHTIPGGSTGIPPKHIFGNICTDFDSTEAIWLFFKHNARK